MRLIRCALIWTCISLAFSHAGLAANDMGAGLAVDAADEAYARIRAEAEVLAGDPGDIPQRVVFLHELYLESGKVFEFPEVALHGALWAYRFFRVESFASQLASFVPSWPGNWIQDHVADAADSLSLALKSTNREVFVDTYTNYRFSKEFGSQPGAERHLSPDLLDRLNRMHAAAAQPESVGESERRELFLASLQWEQEETVSARVREAVSHVDPPLLREAMLRPVVRFAYFPVDRVFAFRDFSDQSERIRRATDAYDIAVQVTWDEVTRSIRDYGVLPDAFFADPSGYADQLRRNLLQGNPSCPDC